MFYAIQCSVKKWFFCCYHVGRLMLILIVVHSTSTYIKRQCHWLLFDEELEYSIFWAESDFLNSIMHSANLSIYEFFRIRWIYEISSNFWKLLNLWYIQRPFYVIRHRFSYHLTSHNYEFFVKNHLLISFGKNRPQPCEPCISLLLYQFNYLNYVRK